MKFIYSRLINPQVYFSFFFFFFLFTYFSSEAGYMYTNIYPELIHLSLAVIEM